MVQGPSIPINFKSLNLHQDIKRWSILTSSIYRQGNREKDKMTPTEIRIHGSNLNFSPWKIHFHSYG